MFIAFVTGKFGANLILDYMGKVKEFPSLKIPNVAATFFTLALQAMGDAFRRFSLPMRSFPWIAFGLHGLDHDNFVQEYDRLRKMAQECKSCADLEFSHIILAFLPEENERDDGRLLREGHKAAEAFK